MRLIIAGSRYYDKWDESKKMIDKCVSGRNVDEVVSGACSSGVKTHHVLSIKADVYGADGLGERWATIFDVTVKRFPADWKQYGRSAGHKRNVQMAEYGDELIAFWDGNTIRSGTYDMINCAIKERIPIHIINISGKEPNPAMIFLSNEKYNIKLHNP